jgi:hypothetical protein
MATARYRARWKRVRVETHDVYVAEPGERKRLEQLAADAPRPDHQHLRRLPHERAPDRTQKIKTPNQSPERRRNRNSTGSTRPSLTLTASSDAAAAMVAERSRVSRFWG